MSKLQYVSTSVGRRGSGDKKSSPRASTVKKDVKKSAGTSSTTSEAASARKRTASNEAAATRNSGTGRKRPSAGSTASSATGKVKSPVESSRSAVKAAEPVIVNKQQSTVSKQAARNKEFDDFFTHDGKDVSVKQSGNGNVQKKAQRSKPKRKKKKKLSKLQLLLRTIFIGACLLLSWCLFAYYVIIFNEQQQLHKADAGIILGAALWNEQPSPALKERLDYSIELYEQGLFDYFILSGGKPSYSRGLSEAEGMKVYLERAGIPDDRLLLETQSSDTYENLLFSERVADKHQLSSAIIITHNYHTKRSEDIAHFVGLKHVQTAGVKTEVLNESYHYTREMLAYTKWQINKLMMPLGLSI